MTCLRSKQFSNKISLFFCYNLNHYVSKYRHSSYSRTKHLVQSFSPKFPATSDDPTRFLPEKQFREISQIITEFDSGEEIFKFISSSCPQNTQLWGQAIQKSIKLNDIESAINMMNIMYKENIKRTVITYNNLFTGLVKSHYGVNECFKYLSKMTDFDHIKPNSIVCGTLCRGVRIENDEMNIDIDKIKQIEKLISKYDIKPDVLCFSELIRIYIKCYKLRKGYFLWKQMYETYKLSLNDDLNNLEDRAYFKPFMSATTDLLNGLASNAGKRDIKKMMKIWRLLTKELNFYGDRIIYGVLMKGLLNNYQYNNNLNNLSLILMFWREMVEIKNINPDYRNFHFISKCYLKIIEHIIDSNDVLNEENESQIKMCLNKLMFDIPNERVKYKLKINDHILARYQFQAYCILYYDNNYQKVLKLFNNLKNDHKLGISVMQQSDQNVIIDLNQCQYQKELSFLLRYLFNNYQNMVIDKDLLIIIGKNTDNDSEDTVQRRYHQEKIENAHKLKDYLTNILNLLDPNITLIQINDNMVKIDKTDINIISRKLSETSQN